MDDAKNPPRRRRLDHTVSTSTASFSARLAAVGPYFPRPVESQGEFAWFMAMGNLRARNATTALGLVWWVLNPLLLGGVYYLVFGVILDVSRDLGHLLSGMFVFYFTSTALTGGANAIVSNSRLLANIRFPRLVLPSVSVIEASVGFLASLPALYAILLVTEGTLPSFRQIWILPIAFAFQIMFNLGLASLAGRIAVPFRDVNNLIPYLLRLWLYLSPIIYSADLLLDRAPELEQIYNLNPMVSFLSLYRSALLGSPFEPQFVIGAAVWAFVIMTLGVVSFIAFEGKMARYL